MLEFMYNLLPFSITFKVYHQKLDVWLQFVITYPLFGFICSYNIIINFGIKLEVSNVSYHGCYRNLLSLILLQVDVKDNFNCHMELIKSHYCNKQHLELEVELLDSSTSLEVAKICPSSLSTSGFDMQANIFKLS